MAELRKQIGFISLFFLIGCLCYELNLGIFKTACLTLWIYLHGYLIVKLIDLKNENRLLLRKHENICSLYKRLQKTKELDTKKKTDQEYDDLTKLYSLNKFKQLAQIELKQRRDVFQYYLVCINLLPNLPKENLNTPLEGQKIITLADKLLKNFAPAYLLTRYDYYKIAIGVLGKKDDVNRLVFRLHKLGVVKESIVVVVHQKNNDSITALLMRAEKEFYKHQAELVDGNKAQNVNANEVAASLAHEIRNPLSSIRGFVQMSARDIAGFKKWEGIILSEIDRINEMVKRMLWFDESTSSTFVKFNLNKLVEDTTALLKPEAAMHGHSLELHPPKQIVEMEGEAEQLKQVFINIIKNSLEAMLKDNKGTIKLMWKVKNNKVQIRLQDNGAGIATENIGRVFEPFFTTKVEGTGMGLAICRKIIEKHKGSIDLTSKIGLGTVFNISLPLKQKTKARRPVLEMAATS